MIDVLVARSIPAVVRQLAWATGKIREATALKRRVRTAEAGEGDRLSKVVVVTDGTYRAAVLLQSEIDTLLNSQPLKDGFAHADAILLTERARAVMGGS